MKVAAVALVLLIGAAVVLAFANTLNSWVLGGLIGGLAALLISIPISLILFTILARRHDERQRIEDAVFVREEQARFDDYEDAQNYDDYEGYQEVYETEAYVLPTDDEAYGEARRSPGRRLPDPRVMPESPYPRLPAAGQSQASTRSSYEQRTYPRQPRQPARPQIQGRGQTPQRPHSRRQTRELQPRSSRGMQQSAALRAARREAARQYEDDLEVIPTTTAPLRRPSSVRPSQ